MEENVYFVENLRKIRISKGLTAEKLAEKAALSENHIRQLEKGTKSPTLSSLISIANALGITLDCLIYDLQPHELCCLNIDEIKNLSNRQLQLLTEIIDFISRKVVGVYDDS